MRGTIVQGRRPFAALLLAPLLLAAGDVDVKVRKGNLIVRGDQQANHVVITQLGTGSYTVSGLAGTTINGGTEGSFDGITRKVKVLLRGGDDTLELVGDVSGTLRVVAGPGNDTVDLQGGFLGDKLQLATGAGNDTVLLTTVDVARTTRIATGGGDDEIAVTGSALQGKARFVTGGGSDQVTLAGTFLGGAVKVTLGGGDDQLMIQGLTGTTFQGAGGGGVDTAQDEGQHLLDGEPVLKQFETLVPTS